MLRLFRTAALPLAAAALPLAAGTAGAQTVIVGSAPVVSYYAPAPVVTYAAPAAVVTTPYAYSTTYRYGILPRHRYTVTNYYYTPATVVAPVVTPAPAVRYYYAPVWP
jgi:hypothetical protein